MHGNALLKAFLLKMGAKDRASIALTPQQVEQSLEILTNLEGLDNVIN